MAAILGPISLRNALRVEEPCRLAITGAGGKTSLLFRLARELSGPVVVTTSTHLGREQVALADHHFTVHNLAEIEAVFQAGLEGVTLFSSDESGEGRVHGLESGLLNHLADLAEKARLSLLVEADGSRRMPLKAPASHEPAIPEWVRQVVVVAGLSGIGQPLDEAHVHRVGRFGELAGIAAGEAVMPGAVERVLLHPQGGLKNIPANARRSVVLNQADTDILQSTGGQIARKLLVSYAEALVTRLADLKTPVKAVFSPVAGIILAAGRSQRMGKPAKVVMDWQGEPFVRRVARTALEAGLKPVSVISGAAQAEVRQALEGLPVEIVHNEHWAEGQSTSIHSGVRTLPGQTGAAIFLLADQPQVNRSILTALVEEHQATLAPIIAPLIDDRRANPVLFDRCAFESLLTLSGDVGGRALFSKFTVHYLPWHDTLLLLDVDTPEDYQKLLDESHARTNPNSE
jgi:molybdenum cofactor cytidylyltransferase